MKAGDIVMVDWRDALPGSGEPSKRRPAVVVGADAIYGGALPFKIVVPMTTQPALAIEGLSLAIAPSAQNGCVKTTFALSWNAQTVPHARITTTSSRILASQLEIIRSQIANCIHVVRE